MHRLGYDVSNTSTDTSTAVGIANAAAAAVLAFRHRGGANQLGDEPGGRANQGIHFEQGDLEGRAAGRVVARTAWARAQSLFRGSAD